MPHIEALSIAPLGAERVLTRDQRRFNTLIRQIEQARATLAAWQEKTLQYAEAHVRVVKPLQTQLRETQRQWVFALDQAMAQRKWTRTEQNTLTELLCDTAGGLLSDGDDDAELKALFEKHAQVDFEAERLEALRALKAVTESMTGLDLGADQDIRTEEELLHKTMQGMQQQFEAADAEREARASSSSKPRQTAAQRRREDAAQQATQSVREVFRKLASALHPDRETDAAQRETKTALMQEVNQAYAQNDLLTLLTLQLRVEQVDAGHMATADAGRVKHYNKVLAEQLNELKAEIGHVEMGFCMDFGLNTTRTLNPSKLGAVLERETQLLRGELAQAGQALDLLQDVAATKRWLKTQRQVLRQQAAMADFDFF